MEEYQGWTNSKTWNYSWLIDQDIKSNKYLESIARQRKVTAEDLKTAFSLRADKVPFEKWVTGKVNYNEIAQEWNDKEWV